MEDSNRILGLDIGSKRTGVAISDESQKISFPLTTLEASGKKQLSGLVRALVDEHGISKIVVGMPFDLSGEKGQSAQLIQTYIDSLRSQLKMPVIEWDERLTTAQAERTLITADLSRKKRKKVIDKLAATILLQNFLDNQHQELPTW